MARANTRVGSRIAGRFRLRRILDAGGSATVWYADDEEAGGAVALKLLHPKLRRSSAHRARAQREADVLARLNHLHITPFVAADLADEQPYIAMGFVEGATLARDIEERREANAPPSANTLLAWFDEIADALTHAHAQGIIHRDLKPSNVVLGQERVMLLDFGIAKLLSRDGEDATTRGRSLGTFSYMAPEQARGEAIDRRADVFALGVLLYEAATLERAFGSAQDSPGEILARTMDGPRPQVSKFRPDLAALDPVVARALAPKPDDRTPSAEAFAKELRRALQPAPKRSGLWAGLALAGGLGVVAWWMASQPGTAPVEKAAVVDVVTTQAPTVTTRPTPAPPPDPVEAPEPVETAVAERKKPTRRRPTKAARPRPPPTPSPAPPPAPAAPTRSPLQVALQRARAVPKDQAALKRLANAIRREAAKLPATKDRAKVERLVSVGLMMRRLDGLERAHDALVDARR